MDEDTRIAALKKVDGMKSVVGYPDELINDSIIEKYYSDLELIPDQLLYNILNLNRLSNKNEIIQLRKPVIDRNYWTDTGRYIAIANAFYTPQLNTMGNELQYF